VSVRHEGIFIHFQSFFLLGQRNKVVFNGGVVDDEEIFSLAQLKGWLWLKYKWTRISFSYSDWYFSPLKCLQSLVSCSLDHLKCIQWSLSG